MPYPLPKCPNAHVINPCWPVAAVCHARPRGAWVSFKLPGIVVTVLSRLPTVTPAAVKSSWYLQHHDSVQGYL